MRARYTTNNSGGLIALQPGSSKAGVRKRGKSSLGAPLPTISPNGRVVTYSNFAVSGTWIWKERDNRTVGFPYLDHRFLTQHIQAARR